MPRFSTNAIILNCIDFGESDKIVCALTRDRGVIHAIAKGAKRSKVRFPGTLEPFCEVSLDIFSRKSNELQRIESASLENANLAIREDIELLAYASVLIELIKEHLGELDPSPETYQSLRGALAAMDPSVQWFSIWSVSMMNILASLGYGINLKDSGEARHRDSESLSLSGLSTQARTFMINGLRLDTKVLAKLTLGVHARREVTEFLLCLCNRISDKKLKSTSFLAKLLDLNLNQ